ncbi:MAG: DUF3857 domain-containing protein, partial [Bryocella sp.]
MITQTSQTQSFKHISNGAMFAGIIFASLWGMALPAHADVFTKPTAEELAMKSLPAYPGAPAVMLYEEEITKDDLHVHQFYYRVKVLTEKGKDYANVQLGVYNGQGDNNAGNEVADIQARTIHADGTIIPFTGKPYKKMVEKGKDYKVEESIFTLPDVEVGSILEYRYAMRYDDNYYEAPRWYIQKDIFVKSAHYAWYPTSREMADSDTNAIISTITWFPVLPEGVDIKQISIPGGMDGPKKEFELKMSDIPPIIEEDFMPPVKSFTFRVLFNFTAFHDGAEYWKVKGKKWSKRADSFIGPNNDLREATKTVIGDATTNDQKLHKIYAAVMTVENTDFTRKHEQSEDKTAGLAKVTNASDVWKNKRGNDDEITKLFIGMARAAGFKAYYMTVTGRADSLFISAYLNFNQLNSTLAIVTVDGKDLYFDPGARYCQYGHLTWGDTYASGLRQVDGGGTAFAAAPGEAYTANQEARSGNFTIDAHGGVTGKVGVAYVGDPALLWRQQKLRGDEE